MLRFCFVLIILFLLTSCDLKIFNADEAEVKVVAEKKNEILNLSSDPEKGKAVYNANCIPCHNYDPQKPGSIGPQIYGSSMELLSDKINLGKYPKNYKPKRSTKIMPLLPHLNQQLSNLHAFLNARSD